MNQMSKDVIRKTDTQIRINKYLSDSGYCSRREADRLIEKGLVTVDGIPAKMGQKIQYGQTVSCAGQIIKPENNMIILAFNKPEGIECTTSSDVPGNIIDYIDFPSRIFPIGRLDRNSSGLILMTNTGELSDKILRGSNYHEKEYEVTVCSKLNDDFIRTMSCGVTISLDDGKRKVTTRPCKVEMIDSYSFRIILTQGLNRQIRRMCLALGYKVKTLKRVRIMNIDLGSLETGKYRYLTDTEARELIQNLQTTVQNS